MSKYLNAAAILAILLLLFAGFAQAPGGRVVAIGDVHGNLDGLVAILLKAGLIDASRHWTGGTATFVQTGDLLDRGPQSRAVLDFMMTLQKEAPRHNGSVRISLGNHEVMNVMGDLRYVVPADYAAFTDSRSGQRRKTAFQNYSKQEIEHGRAVNETTWIQAHPLGFIEREEAFGPMGAYGRWLRSFPTVNVVDDSIFLHGGIAPELATWTAGKINDAVRAEIQAFDKYKQFMIGKKLALPFFTFEELVSAAKDELNRKGDGQDRDDLETLNHFLQFGAWLSINEKGPLWFRGYDTWAEEEGTANIARLTDVLKVKRIVAGHTPQPNGEITQRFAGKVFLIDTGMLSTYFAGGRASALNIQDGKLSAIYLDATKALN